MAKLILIVRHSIIILCSDAGPGFLERGFICKLKPTAIWSPYIFTLVQKVKHRVYKIHVFLSEAILCQDSASYFI